VVFHERRKGDAPGWLGGVELLEDVLLPYFFARGGVEAMKESRGADGVELAVVQRRRGARAGAGAVGVLAIVGKAPNLVAGVQVETEDDLLILLAHQGVDAVGIAHEGGVTFADVFFPGERRALGRPSFE